MLIEVVLTALLGAAQQPPAAEVAGVDQQDTAAPKPKKANDENQPKAKKPKKKKVPKETDPAPDDPTGNCRSH